jgi:release factor glutamine methyltransferase
MTPPVPPGDAGGAQPGDGDDTLAWGVLADMTARRLESAGVHNAVTEARWMVEVASGMVSGGLSAEQDLPATVGAVTRVEAMVERRRAGEPLQYVLGEWSFRTLDLMVDSRVLIPRPETEHVVQRALDELARVCPAGGGRAPVVVDLGTGSGAIALSIAAERRDAVVVATDVSSDALAVAAANLAGLGTAGGGVTLASGSWFSALADGHTHLAGSVDLVISNPPYVADHEQLPAEVVNHEPPGALVSGPTGTESIDEIVPGAREWLRRGGVLVVEIAPHQSGHVVSLARAAGFDHVQVADDLTGRPRMLVAHWPGHQQGPDR